MKEGKILATIPLYVTQEAEIYLNYLAFNSPEYLIDLYKRRKLKSVLSNVVNQALVVKHSMTEKGMPHYMADEIITREILCPKDPRQEEISVSMSSEYPSGICDSESRR